GFKENSRLLGLKGEGLALMTEMELPVPPGFIITTEICEKFFDAGMRLPDGLMNEVKKAIRELELQVGLIFGDPHNPLLLSVRSGSSTSMPGVMATILNVGLNEDTVLGLASQKKSNSFAWDCYKRFVQMLTQTALGLEETVVSKICDEVKDQDTEGLKKI